MKKSFLIVSAIFLGLTACSSTPKNPVDATPGRTADVEFLEANGPLTLTFDDKGNWLEKTEYLDNKIKNRTIRKIR